MELTVLDSRCRYINIFGYSLPHSSTAQRYEGTAVSWNEKQPGDLICYQVVNGVGHVAIYIGDNQIIHAGAKTLESVFGMLITELGMGCQKNRSVGQAF